MADQSITANQRVLAELWTLQAINKAKRTSSQAAGLPSLMGSLEEAIADKSARLAELEQAGQSGCEEHRRLRQQLNRWSEVRRLNR